ncbi:hypothetical protein DFH29DRAFT_1084624 [Suillus ampliporus]|nr:hypothetical protein DFH29DRAFT_1084624 [Suillus ampliporus]
MAIVDGAGHEEVSDGEGQEECSDSDEQEFSEEEFSEEELEDESEEDCDGEDGFFDDASATRSIHPGSSTYHRGPAHSSANPRALLNRLSTLFRSSHYDTNEPTDLQQRPRQTLFSHHGLRVVDVPTVQDKRSLVVTRPRERRPSGTRPVTTFWAYLVLLLCCASPRMAERTQQQQQGQPQDQDQALASSSQTQPAATSTSRAPPAHTTAPGAADTRS